MFATFSPDGQRVAYVREHDLYAEELATGAVTRLTHDGSRTSINGTSDWVYEEELGIRQAFQWSPDSKRLLFWHFDASAVRDFLLINNTDSLYPSTTPIPYPKAGTTNSRVTLGGVAPTGGRSRGSMWWVTPRRATSGRWMARRHVDPGAAPQPQAEPQRLLGGRRDDRARDGALHRCGQRVGGGAGTALDRDRSRREAG
ncbi:MAG: DPP IV N-terminal domain-containing protein [Gemmatimonadetes bacterium]|nr:DPP IV N-terminal domain-containing protein [Gemmatimonadota bacterium]